MENNYKKTYSLYLDKFNAYLQEVFLSLDKSAPKNLIDCMQYSVLDGGKRVRPVLCLATASMLGVDFDKVKKFALSLECIHSYSLVHDDLPEMDNDDYRRGKLSTHKKFGQANGVLAGDALLNFAFEHCLLSDDFDKVDAKALAFLAECAGYRGMIAGQVKDLQMEKCKTFSKDDLYEIYKNKTAKLIIAPLVIPSILANSKYYDNLYEFGYNLGIMFQIVDDIMDVEGTFDSIGKTPHKDESVDKLTAIKIFGVEGAKNQAKLHYDLCLQALKDIPNNDFLLELTNAMFNRRS